MKKHLYPLLALLMATPSMATPSIATQKLATAVMVASTLLVGNKYDKQLSRDLYYALREERYTVAEKLINNPKVDVNIKDKDGYTPLMWCCYKGNDIYLGIAKLLLKASNIDVNLNRSYGHTPLIYCCEYLNPTRFSLAKLLLGNANIDVNKQRCEYKPLDYIISNVINGNASDNHVKLWNMLVAKGALLNKYQEHYQHINPNRFTEPKKSYVQSIINNPPRNCIHNKKSNNPKSSEQLSRDLYYALEEERYTVAEKLINNPKLDVNAKLIDGYTPLLWCLVKGDKYLSLAKLLLKDSNIDVNALSNSYRPLTYFCEYLFNDPALNKVKLLLGHPNIDVNKHYGQYKPLDYIIYKVIDSYPSDNDVKLWNMLVAKGAVLNKYKEHYQYINPNRFTEPRKGYVQSIINNPPKNCIHNKKNNNPKSSEQLSRDLYYALREERYTVAEKLINNPKLDVNAKLIDGNTPLLWCCYKGKDTYLGIVKLLLKPSNIDVNLKGPSDYTPLAYCCGNLNPARLSLAKLLLGNPNIDVNKQHGKYTPLDFIIANVIYGYTSDNHVKLWNILVAKGAVLNKYQEHYQHINPNRFTEPQKSYVQWIKNTPPINLLPFTKQLTNKNDQLRKDLEERKKTNSNEVKQKDSKIQDLTNQLTTSNRLKDEKEQTIQQQKKTINNHLSKINNQKKTIQNKHKEIQGLTKQLNISKQTVQQQTEEINNKDENIHKLKEQMQHYLSTIERLKEQANQTKHRFEVFKSTIKQKKHDLKEATKKTISRLDRSQKNLEKERDRLNHMLHTTKQQVQQKTITINEQNNTIKSLINQLITTTQTVKKQGEENDLLRKEIKKLKSNSDDDLSLNLCDAIDEEDYTLAQKLINNPQVNINIQDDNGLTPLLWCCLNGDKSLSIAKLLLEDDDINVSLKDNSDKNALHIACSKGALHILGVLFRQSDISRLLQEQDHQKKTPLDLVFDQIMGQYSNITYVAIWSMLVIQGATLNLHAKAYKKLNLNNFKEPQKTYVRLIKQNPPKNFTNNTNNKFMDNEEAPKDDE